MTGKRRGQLQSPMVFLVRLAQWHHTDSIPNSEVKRCSGDDTLGVALRYNSSVPGLIFTHDI